MVTQDCVHVRQVCAGRVSLPAIVDRTQGANTEQRELQQLIGLLQQPDQHRKLPASQDSNPVVRQWPCMKRSKGQTDPPETSALQHFCQQYHAERTFSKHAYHKKFLELCTLLVKLRLCNSVWMEDASPDAVLHLLICLRIILRDPVYQSHFFQLGAEGQLSGYMERATGTYLQRGETHCIVDILKEMTNIFQKLSSIVEQQQRVIACGAHRSLVLLLTANDVLLLHCSLAALVCLAQSQRTCELLADMNCIEQLLIIIQTYDNVSKKQATRLLGQLCQDVRTATALKLHDGVPILLSQLVSDNASLLNQAVRCIGSLCADPEISKNVRQMGGIPILLSILHDRTFISEQTEANGSGSAGIQLRSGVPDQDFIETQYKLKQACCNALCQLVLSDTNAQQIAEANGVYSLGQLILPPGAGVSTRERKAATQLQRSAFRTLRFLFSMERNRRLFKKLFPADLYTLFIDVGHYNWDMAAYKALVQAINSLPSEQLRAVRDSVNELNQNRTPTHYIKDYAVFEHLGRGAFGSVYKVRKKGGQTFVALKEIDMKNPAFGKTATDRDKSMGEALSELQIMRQGIRHPNIVRYHKTFVQGSTLFIIMDLIEGAPLNEHFNSLREKQARFTEARIWHILLQMLQALRYLHKDKGIVHRDLTPNNIMLAEDDKVTITDFGLAKVKGTDTSKMTSQCGTILYSCPEMVEGAPYTEKADVWALGCILYQMCVLDPPFFNTNMLTLVTHIVEGIYKPIPAGLCSDRLVNLIKRCICPRAEDRPDTEQLAASVSDIILRYMDTVQSAQVSLQNKLDRERRKTQKHFVEANQLMQRYHRLFTSPTRPCSLGDSSNGLVNTGCDSLQSSALNSPQDTEWVGWTSDDDSCQSSECDSLSRESSAGSSRGGSQRVHGHLPPVPTPHSLSQQLAVDIPQIGKVSRDSGFGSCDLSPVSPEARRYSRSHSTPGSASSQKKKTVKAKEPQTLTISHRRVRQISDPISQLLHTLHKIIYISQLPPTLSPNPRRRVIERFKRALFAPGSSSLHLKGELHKLNIGSREVIDLNVGSLCERLNSAGSDWSLGSGCHTGTSDARECHTGTSDAWECRGGEGRQTARSRSSSGARCGSAGSDSSLGSTIKDTPTPRSLSDTLTAGKPPDSLNLDVTYLEQDDNVTYEQLQSMIETVLVECGYYSGANESRPGSKGALPQEIVRVRIQ